VQSSKKSVQANLLPPALPEKLHFGARPRTIEAMGKLLKWIVIIAVLVVAWKVGVPWVKKQNLFGSGKTASKGRNPCISDALDASDTWGKGLSGFVNPPYDVAAWSSFRSTVESRIAQTESDCNCSEDWCRTVRSAMSDFRGLISEMDASIRSGSAPPEDMVQRQESIDNRINEAAAELDAH
jgi:hypothetical protein